MSESALLEILQSELQVVTSFMQCLQDEHQALLERAPVSTFNEIIQRKQHFAARLEMLGSQRDAALVALGHNTGHAGTVEAAAEHPQVGAVWAELQQMVEQARVLNERNGLLIRTHLRYTTAALDALRTAQGVNLYQPDGKKSSPAQLGTSRRA